MRIICEIKKVFEKEFFGTFRKNRSFELNYNPGALTKDRKTDIDFFLK